MDTQMLKDEDSPDYWQVPCSTNCSDWKPFHRRHNNEGDGFRAHVRYGSVDGLSSRKTWKVSIFQSLWPLPATDWTGKLPVSVVYTSCILQMLVPVVTIAENLSTAIAAESSSPRKVLLCRITINCWNRKVYQSYNISRILKPDSLACTGRKTISSPILIALTTAVSQMLPPSSSRQSFLQDSGIWMYKRFFDKNTENNVGSLYLRT